MIREAIHAWNDAAGAPDDAPLWAEVLGVVLAFGLALRGGAHVWTALLNGVDPTLAENDVSDGNAVAAARGAAWRVDALGRLLAAGIGLTLWLGMDPATLAVGKDGLAAVAVRLAAVLNLGLLCADPVLFATYRLRTNRLSKLMHDNDPTQRDSEVTD